MAVSNGELPTVQSTISENITMTDQRASHDGLNIVLILGSQCVALSESIYRVFDCIIQEAS
jgi:hypothetical protein